MTHLAGEEGWEEKPRAIAYFCNALPDLEAIPDRQRVDWIAASRDRVRRNAIYVPQRDIAHLWPNACGPEGSFKWELLADARSRKKNARLTGERRFDTQFWVGERQPERSLHPLAAGKPDLPHFAPRSHLRQSDDRGGLDRLRLQCRLRRSGGDVGYAGRARDFRGARDSTRLSVMTTHNAKAKDAKPRVKRPIPDRVGPIRSWAAAANPNPQTANGNGPRADPNIPVDHQDPIVRGVVAGGRVVDEWIRQAQQTARLLGGTRSTAGWADASGQMFKTASDMMAAWWSLFGVNLPNAAAGFGSQRPSADFESAWAAGTPAKPVAGEAEPPDSPPPVGAERTSSSSAGPRVRLEIASRRPVDVTVDLYRRGTVLFRVLDLRPQSGDAPRIQGTTLEVWETEGVRLRLAVPDDQPPGTYHAVVLDPVLDSAVGTVTLRIPD